MSTCRWCLIEFKREREGGEREMLKDRQEEAKPGDEGWREWEEGVAVKTMRGGKQMCVWERERSWWKCIINEFPSTSVFSCLNGDQDNMFNEQQENNFILSWKECVSVKIVITERMKIDRKQKNEERKEKGCRWRRNGRDGRRGGKKGIVKKKHFHLIWFVFRMQTSH